MYQYKANIEDPR